VLAVCCNLPPEGLTSQGNTLAHHCCPAPVAQALNSWGPHIVAAQAAPAAFGRQVSGLSADATWWSKLGQVRAFLSAVLRYGFSKSNCCILCSSPKVMHAEALARLITAAVLWMLSWLP